MGPHGNLVFGDCSSKKLAFPQAQCHPNAMLPRFAENFQEYLLLTLG